MKKITFFIIATFMLLSVNPLQSKAEIKDPPTAIVVVKPEVTEEVKVLMIRLNEINDMDKTGLKSSEKKTLRLEVKSIQRRLSGPGDGIYISAGAIIIILLLLLILL